MSKIFRLNNNYKGSRKENLIALFKKAKRAAKCNAPSIVSGYFYTDDINLVKKHIHIIPSIRRQIQSAYYYCEFEVHDNIVINN